MTRRLRPLALTSIFLFTACGGVSPSQPVTPSGTPSQASGSTPEAPPASTNPVSTRGPAEAGEACGLLSDADIMELTSFEVDVVEQRSAGGIYVSGCYWALTDGGVVQAEILLGVLPQGGRTHFDTVVVPVAEGTGGEPLEGLGDDAIVGSGGASVQAVTGDVLLDLNWLTPTSGSTDVPVALMKRALANLGGS